MQWCRYSTVVVQCSGGPPGPIPRCPTTLRTSPYHPIPRVPVHHAPHPPHTRCTRDGAPVPWCPSKNVNFPIFSDKRVLRNPAVSVIPGHYWDQQWLYWAQQWLYWAKQWFFLAKQWFSLARQWFPWPDSGFLSQTVVSLAKQWLSLAKQWFILGKTVVISQPNSGYFSKQWLFPEKWVFFPKSGCFPYPELFHFSKRAKRSTTLPYTRELRR